MMVDSSDDMLNIGQKRRDIMVGAIKKYLFKFICLLLLAFVLLSLLCPVRVMCTENAPPVITGGELSSYLGNSKNTDISIVSDDMPGEYIRLKLSENPEDPSVTFYPPSSYNAEDVEYIIIPVRTNRADSRFKLYLSAGQSQGFGEDSTSYVWFSPDHEWQMLIFDLRDTDGWSGEIHSIRLDYIDHAQKDEEPGDYTDIAGIALCPDENSVIDAINILAKSLCSPANRFDNFTEEAVSAFDHAVNFTGISVVDSNLVFSLEGTAQCEDPYLGLNYQKLTQIYNCEALDAEDVAAVIIRLKGNDKIYQDFFELFYYAGSITGANQQYSMVCQYDTAGQWDGVMFDFDGRNDFAGAINGFRFDWNCGSYDGAELEISDILIFDDINSADLYMDFIEEANLISEDGGGEDDSEKQTEDEISDSTDEEQSTGFEQEENTEETGGLISDTEATDDSDSVNEEDTSAENETDNGSEIPFYIMCVFLVCLSIGSVVTVVVIRVLNKKQN